MALLIVGSNGAWGDKTTIYEKTVTDWSSSDVTTTEGTVGKWYNSVGIVTGTSTGMSVVENTGLRVCSANAGSISAKLKLNRNANTIVTLDVSWNIGNTSANANVPYCEFIYGDLKLHQVVDTREDKRPSTYYSINGTNVKSGNLVADNGTVLDIHLVVNTFSGEISEFYIKNDEDYIAQFSDLTSTTNHFSSSANYDDIIINAYKSGNNQYTWNAIKSITIKEETQTIYTYKVNAVDASNNLLSILYEYQSLSEETITQYWNKGINVGGVWYMADAQASTPHYGHAFTTGETVNVTFRPSDAVYYVEAEDLSGWYNQNNKAEYASGGKTRFLATGGSTTTNFNIGAGRYDMCFSYIRRGSGNGNVSSHDIYVKTGNSETRIEENLTIWGKYNESQTYTKPNIDIPEGSEIKFSNVSGGNSTLLFDYIYLKKSAVTYTVKYKCGGVEIKDADATRTAVWGTTISLTDADKANVPGTNKHYEYVSDDAATQVIAADGSTVITVYFKQVDEAYKWGFTELTDNADVDVDQTESIKENNIDCYNTTLSIANGLYFQPSSSGGVPISAWKCYRKNDSTPGLRNVSSGDRQCIIPNLIAGDKIVISGNADAINGISGAKYEGTKDTDNNTYTVTMAADGNYYFKLAKVNSSSTPAIYPNIKSIVVYRELTEIIAPIVSTTGYATLSSTYALDFTGIETLTAYKATTCDGTSVTLEPVTGTVAPNTGLVIKGVTTNIPVVATGDVQDGNLLQPCDGSWTTLNKSDTGTNYVLSEQGDPKVAVFAPIINTPATLRAGVAYLYVPSGSGSSRTLNIVFADDEATAVFDINDKSEMINDKWYDLQGRRVIQPTKGLYIVNGRKVVVK